jgi:hypothetical protein
VEVNYVPECRKRAVFTYLSAVNYVPECRNYVPECREGKKKGA